MVELTYKYNIISWLLRYENTLTLEPRYIFVMNILVFDEMFLKTLRG